MEILFFLLFIPALSILILGLTVIFGTIAKKFGKTKGEILFISIGSSAIILSIFFEIFTNSDLSLSFYGSLFLASACVYFIGLRS